MKRVCALALALAWGSAKAQSLPSEQVRRGAVLYESNCQTCHGARLANPPWAPDLRKFPREDRARFIDTVTYGRRGMPPWDDVLKPDDIEALWAYVLAGEGNK